MKRGGPLRPVGDTAYAKRDRDFDYMGWVKWQRCCVAVEMGSDEYCSGGFADADHAGGRGLGVKCPDDETIPMCATHHAQRTTYRGYFDGWVADQMRTWLDYWINRTRQRWLAIKAAGPLPF